MLTLQHHATPVYSTDAHALNAADVLLNGQKAGEINILDLPIRTERQGLNNEFIHVTSWQRQYCAAKPKAGLRTDYHETVEQALEDALAADFFAS